MQEYLAAEAQHGGYEVQDRCGVATLNTPLRLSWQR